MKILCIIPAKKKSTELKNKNLKKLGKLPLVEISIKLSKKIKYFDKVFVSTDSNRIQSIAKRNNVLCPFLRPNYLSTKKTPMVKVIRNVLNYFRKENYYPDAIAIMQPTSPLRSIKTINSLCKKFLKFQPDSLGSIEKIKHTFHPKKIIKSKKKEFIIKNFELLSKPNRQEEPEYYGLDGGVLFIFKSKNIKKKIIWGKTLFVAVPKIETFDIDDVEDFKICKLLYSKM